MALSKSVLAHMMKTAMDGVPEKDRANQQKTFEALAGAIIDHIKTAGVVTVPATGLVAPPGAGGGPVIGAAVGTIT